jgi:motility quorum-sensing regulator/GCU-specific mRNA interferase toxin
MATKKLPPGVTGRASEKQTPHFDLAQVKRLVAQHGAACFTLTALQGVQAMALTISESMAAIAGINQAACFYKSMSSTDFPGMWQDVYRVPTPKGDAYVKFQITLPSGGSNAPRVVIQFKAR